MHCPKAEPARLGVCLATPPPLEALATHVCGHHDVQDMQRVVRNTGKKPFHRVMGGRESASRVRSDTASSRAILTAKRLATAARQNC